VPFYYTIDSSKPSGRRTAARLLALREQLDKEVPERSLTQTLNLATWNIREFDSTKYGTRTDESLSYIAEIVSRFDLVAVQEVHEDLTALRRLCRILGSSWDYVHTDTTRGTRGNRERMAFLYDKRKVRFGGLVGELVLPPRLRRGKGYVPELQFARTPFIAGFQVGWFRFMLCTVHIVWGGSKKESPGRVREIRELAKFLKARATDKTAWSRNLVLLGDFNIFNVGDATFRAITDQGFVVPPEIQQLPSNVDQSRHYDQIAFMTRRRQDLAGLEAGVFDFYRTLYREEDEKTYARHMGTGYRQTKEGEPRSAKSRRTYYRAWRTFQMSDHLPMWVQLKIDFGTEYLRKKARK